jgi:hypothetical protein
VNFRTLAWSSDQDHLAGITLGCLNRLLVDGCASLLHNRPPLASSAVRLCDTAYITVHLVDFDSNPSARSLSCASSERWRHAPLFAPSSITNMMVWLPHSPIHSSSFTRYEQPVSVTRPWPSMRNVPRRRNTWQSRKHGKLTQTPHAVRGALVNLPESY